MSKIQYDLKEVSKSLQISLGSQSGNLSFSRLKDRGGWACFQLRSLSRLANRAVKGKGKNSPHDFSGNRLQGGTKLGQERLRSDTSIIYCAYGFEDFGPECGKPGTEPEHVGMFGWRLFAPIIWVS